MVLSRIVASGSMVKWAGQPMPVCVVHESALAAVVAVGTAAVDKLLLRECYEFLSSKGFVIRTEGLYRLILSARKGHA